MRNSQELVHILLIAIAGACLFRAPGQAQQPVATKLPQNIHAQAARSIEDLNLVGAETSMPPFMESPIDINSAFRRNLLSRGLALRGNAKTQYTQNTMQAPVNADQQSYVGQRPFDTSFVTWTLTSDLRQLALSQAQLYVSGVWNWASWNPAGPKTLQLYGLYFYKSFVERRVEIKAGYICNDLEVIGMSVGGSAASSAQGIYAVLPFEAGLSFLPLASPSFNLRVQGPSSIYLKALAQRSIDADGGPREIARNHTGFRFLPGGDKLLLFGETGYKREASADNNESWYRAGYMRNSTPYAHLATGKPGSGNHFAFALMDQQILKSNVLRPSQGLYLGGTAMAADSHYDAYSTYYELRLYKKAPFASRPFDMASLVSYYSGHSSYLTNRLAASGKTVWRASAAVTGSYSMRVKPGQFMSIGLGYTRGAAITPRVGDALCLSASYAFYF